MIPRPVTGLRHAPGTLALPPAELVLLGAIWGASYLFMRVASAQIGAALLVELRLLLGALILAPALWRHRSAFPAALWPKLALVGAINAALPFMLYAWAAHAAPAGIGAITSATTVLFAALVGLAFFGESIGRRRGLAIFGGLAGVVMLAFDRIAGSPQLVWAVVAGVAASLLYGVGLHLVRRHLSGLPAAALASATLGAAAILVLPCALFDWPQQTVANRSWAAVGALGAICTGLAYLLYYRLIARIGAGRTSTVTYMIPVFGVLWGWLLLDEPITPLMVLSTFVILSSVALGQRA